MSRHSEFHPSLNRARLVMGIGSEAFGLLSALGVMALDLRSPVLAGLVMPLYVFFRWIYRADAWLPRAYLRYLKEPDAYDPWVRSRVRLCRPPGFGRGLHC